MVSDEALKKLQEQIAAWPMTQRFVVKQLIEDYSNIRKDFLAYVNTGLTPERCAEFARADAEGRYIVMRDAKQKGVSRLLELAEADRDGRLLVLPSNKALTNADRMRTATNQQLAKQIYDNQKEFCRLMYKNLGFDDELNFSGDYSDILDWLNAPSKETGKALEEMKNV